MHSLNVQSLHILFWVAIWLPCVDECCFSHKSIFMIVCHSKRCVVIYQISIHPIHTMNVAIMQLRLVKCIFVTNLIAPFIYCKIIYIYFWQRIIRSKEVICRKENIFIKGKVISRWVQKIWISGVTCYWLRWIKLCIYFNLHRCRIIGASKLFSRKWILSVVIWKKHCNNLAKTFCLWANVPRISNNWSIGKLILWG